MRFTDDEMQVNTTLLEFLLREYKIDIRGLDNIASGIQISEIIAMVKMEILNMKNWDVVEEVYLANFSFARYAMWNDVRKNIDKFRKNPMVKSLLNNRLEITNNVFEDKAEDEYPRRRGALADGGGQFAVFRDRGGDQRREFRVARAARNGKIADDHQYHREQPQ